MTASNGRALVCFLMSSPNPLALVQEFVPLNIHVSRLRRGEHSCRRLGVRCRGRGRLLLNTIFTEAMSGVCFQSCLHVTRGSFIFVPTPDHSLQPGCLSSVWHPRCFPPTCSSAPARACSVTAETTTDVGGHCRTPVSTGCSGKTRDLRKQIRLFRVVWCVQTKHGHC